MAGHPAPRIIQTAAGMLNAIGLQNVGVDDYMLRKLPPMKKYPGCKVIVNVFGSTVSEYIQAQNDFWTAVFLIEEAAGVEFKS